MKHLFHLKSKKDFDVAKKSFTLAQLKTRFSFDDGIMTYALAQIQVMELQCTDKIASEKDINNFALCG